MRPKLKYVLPLTQMALCLALIWRSELWLKAAARIMDIPGPAPAFTLLVSINPPAAIVRALWERYLRLPALWDDVMLVVAVGFLWYWVALNIHYWHQRRTVCMFSWLPLRLAGDALLIAAGVFWGFISLGHDFAVIDIVRGVRGEALRNSFPITYSGWLWFTINVGLALAWSFSLIYFFGRDVISCARGR